jgi:hypothetical protein
MNILAGAAGLIHAFIYLSLFAAFAASLLPGREAVVTQLARSARGTLNLELIAYTRGVTVMWCLFFIAEPAASLILYFQAPRALWLVFVSALNLPMVVLVFTGEYLYRRIRLRHYTHESLIETLRLGRRISPLHYGRGRGPFREEREGDGQLTPNHPHPSRLARRPLP